jgi:hypothetical protein
MNGYLPRKPIPFFKLSTPYLDTNKKIAVGYAKKYLALEDRPLKKRWILKMRQLAQ